MLERDRELEALDGALAAAADGSGHVVVIEGSAGIGKSALLAATTQRARALGMTVLGSRGDELVSPIAWSLALDLIGPALAARSASERDALLASAGAPARELFGGGSSPEAPPGSPLDAAIVNALFWVVSGLAEAGPLALLVDDAGWADIPSLQFLAYLANRAADLPIALILARRRAEADPASRGLLDRVAAGAGSVLLQPAPLSTDASAVLVRQSLGERAGDELARACAEATGGNPFYLKQLLAELSHEGHADAERVRSLTPASATRAVLVRLVRLGGDAMALAEAVAVLGDQCAFTTAAQLAGLDRAKAEVALDQLAGVEILRAAEPLGFAHPLVASSVHSEIPMARRGEMQLQAARLLSAGGADPQLIAAQLLTAGRRADEWVVDALREAARAAARRGAPSAAADYLQRALEEPPAPGQRARVLCDLARAEAAAGRPRAVERFHTLLELADGHAERARVQLELGQVLVAQGRSGEALAVFERGRAEQDPPLDDTGRELRAAFWMTKTLAARVSREEVGELEQLIASGQLEQPTHGERALLAVVAMDRAFHCQPCEQVAALARRAWGDGALLAVETSDGMFWTLVTGALLHADELELELQVCEHALADARRRGSPTGFATACAIRAGPLALLGRNDEAIADLQLAFTAREDGWPKYLATMAGALSAAMLERGDLEGARKALQIAEQDPGLADSIEQTVVLVRRGELLLRESHPVEALEALETAGRMLTQAFDYVAWAPWRHGAVRALLALERRDRARELASEMVELTRRLGAPSHLALALRTLACASRGTRALELLDEAVSLFMQRPERLQHAYALIEYGAALRRAGRRGAAGDLLRQGLVLAERGGLRVLATQALAELAAAGARTRPRTLNGIASLTPTERRVAELASRDLSNREIAQQLFVTVKTIEYHLANAYRKLDVRSRTGLAAALADASTPLS